MSDHDQATSIPGLRHGQLCYLQIPAADIAVSARFYERVLGWTIDPAESGFEAPGLIGQWVLDRPVAREAGMIGWIHVDDIADTLARAEREGGSVAQQPEDDGPRLLAAFTDPAGNLVGIVQHGPGAPPEQAPVANRPGAVRAIGNRTMPPSVVIPELVYEDIGDAIEWLCDKLGFAVRWRVGDHRAQLTLAGGTIFVADAARARSGPQSVMIRIGDVDAHHERARSRGAKIVAAPRDFPYGERQYAVEDPAGNQWDFSQSIFDVAPEAWGGTSGPALAAEAPPVTAAISVMLIVPDADAAVGWYTQALGARVLWDLGGVAGLELDGAPFFLHEVNPRNPSERAPAQACATSARIELFAEDPDALLERALAAGATPGSPMTNHAMPWGTHRQGGFKDPFGHNWSVGDKSPLAAS